MCARASGIAQRGRHETKVQTDGRAGRGGTARMCARVRSRPPAARRPRCRPPDSSPSPPSCPGCVLAGAPARPLPRPAPPQGGTPEPRTPKQRQQAEGKDEGGMVETATSRAAGLGARLCQPPHRSSRQHSRQRAGRSRAWPGSSRAPKARILSPFPPKLAHLRPVCAMAAAGVRALNVGEVVRRASGHGRMEAHRAH